MSIITFNANSASIGDVEVKLDYYSETGESQIETPIQNLQGVKACNFPDRLICEIKEIPGYSELSAFSHNIYNHEGQYDFNIFMRDTDEHWGGYSLNTVFREFNKQIKSTTDKPQVVLPEGEDWMFVSYSVPSTETDLHTLVHSFLKQTQILMERTLLALRGFDWKIEYESDEPLFTKEVVIPLLTNMGFDHVRYTHGVEEFGKDVFFSETNRFSEQRYLAAQVKAGSISGESAGMIDKILGQLKHAFSMPYEGAGKSNRFYISEFYVICSGSFTNNAKKVIVSQMEPALIGSVKFLDKNSIQWLSRRHF